MIRVVLIGGRQFPSIATEAGSAEFQGVRITRPDGSTKIPLDSEGQAVPFACSCNPPDILSDKELMEIAAALARNQVIGEAGEYEWRVSDN